NHPTSADSRSMAPMTIPGTTRTSADLMTRSFDARYHAVNATSGTPSPTTSAAMTRPLGPGSETRLSVARGFGLTDGSNAGTPSLSRIGVTPAREFAQAGRFVPRTPGA